jgi:cyanate lyase
MSITEIYKLNEQLTDCLKSIQDLNEEKLIALSNIEYWSSHEDLFDNKGQAIALVTTIERLIALNEDKVKLIINQLNLEIQCINQNQ